MTDKPDLLPCPTWEEVKDEFKFLWNEYALCPDSKLSHDAILLKRNLIALGTNTRTSASLQTPSVPVEVADALADVLENLSEGWLGGGCYDGALASIKAMQGIATKSLANYNKFKQWK